MTVMMQGLNSLGDTEGSENLDAYAPVASDRTIVRFMVESVGMLADYLPAPAHPS